MQTANMHATATSVADGSDFVASLSNTACLLPSSVLTETLNQAKKERTATGKANAYGVLLEAFHRIILPPFFAECGGNLSEVSRLLGIHRETIRRYVWLAEIDISNTTAAGGAK